MSRVGQKAWIVVNFWIPNQIGNWRPLTCKLTDIPLVLASGQFFYDLTQFLWPICPQARYDSIEQQNQWNNRNQIRPQQSRPAERTDSRRVQEHQQNPGEYQTDCRRGAFGDLKYADAFAGIDGILQDGASIVWRKMMERRKHRSQPLQCTRYLHRLNRFWIETNVMIRRRAHSFESFKIRIFIGEPNLKVRGVSCGVLALKVSNKIQPRAPSARTHVNNRLRAVRPVLIRVNHAL